MSIQSLRVYAVQCTYTKFIIHLVSACKGDGVGKG